MALPLTFATVGMAWDLQRFARTAFFFNSPAEVLKRMPVPGRPTPSLGADGELWPALLDFGPLDDVVMGGVSESAFNVSPSGSASFSGIVSTDNNGGFAGCRSRAVSPALDLRSYTGLQLRVRGDDQLRRYKAIVRDSYEWNGIAWSQSFDVPARAAGDGDESWQDVRLPFAAFVPTLFARRVPGAATVDTSQINTVQLTLSKFEYNNDLNPNFATGAFALDVERIAAYR